MFSNINEAWGNDPVKEMTNKLSKGEFLTQPEMANVFNFKNHNNHLNNGQVGGIDLTSPLASTTATDALKNTGKNTGKNTHSDNSGLLSISNMSSDFSPYAKVDFKKGHGHRRRRRGHESDMSVDSESDLYQSDSSFDSMPTTGSDTFPDSRCSYNARHLKKCKRCYVKLNKLIQREFHKRMDEMILKMKMSQLNQSIGTPSPISYQPPQPLLSDTWKETLIIMVGAVIAIFIVFLMIRSITKRLD